MTPMLAGMGRCGLQVANRSPSYSLLYSLGAHMIKTKSVYARDEGMSEVHDMS